MPELLTPGSFGTEATNDRVSSYVRDKNRATRRPLTPFEAKTLRDGELNPIYIYNVSPIHEWKRPQGQLGVIMIQKRPWDKEVSSPRVISGAIVRWVNKGLTIEPFIEGGEEIAQDVCGSGPLDDTRSPNSNLTRFGVFMTHKPFSEDDLPKLKQEKLAHAKGSAFDQLEQEFLLPKHEQKKLMSEATARLLSELQIRILEADNWHQGGPQQRAFIGPWHRENLKAFNFLTGRKESRPWSEISIGESLLACIFCGNMNKPGLPLCPNCKNVLDKAAFEALKKSIGA